MHLYEVIKYPIITEKTQYMAAAQNKYVFEVDRRANKAQVKQAVEAVYDVRVVKVNVMNMPAKASRRWGRRRIVRRAAWKKAVVTLAEGEKLPMFEGG
jgi:large subunit ribosomal protein L23